MSEARWVQNWKQTLRIVQPATQLRWHREGLRPLWKIKSHGQKKSNWLGADRIALIQRLAAEKWLWGAERIRGEMLKLGIHVAKRTIQKYIPAVRPPVPAGQSWSTFLKTHGRDIWACDFVPMVTLFFKTLYVFVLLHLGSRRLVDINVTDHPTDAWGPSSCGMRRRLARRRNI